MGSEVHYLPCGGERAHVASAPPWPARCGRLQASCETSSVVGDPVPPALWRVDLGAWCVLALERATGRRSPVRCARAVPCAPAHEMPLIQSIICRGGGCKEEATASSCCPQGWVAWLTVTLLAVDVATMSRGHWCRTTGRRIGDLRVRLMGHMRDATDHLRVPQSGLYCLR